MLATLRHGVYSQPQSPYLALLRHAGIEVGDIEAAVLDEGVEGALATLYDAGIRVTLDELKGRVPITRPGLELAVSTQDFKNPLARADLRLIGGGTRATQRSADRPSPLEPRRGAPAAVPERDWAGGPSDSGVASLASREYRHLSRAPPRQAGSADRALVRTATALSTARFGSQSGLLAVSLSVAGLVGAGVPWPRHVPLERAAEVARWLAGQVAAGRRPYLNTTASGAVRVCEAAGAEGLDIAGTAFRVGGEPYTPARDRVLTPRAAPDSPCSSPTRSGG